MSARHGIVGQFYATCFITIACIVVGSSGLAQVQTSTNAATGYVCVSRGENQRVWQQTVVQTNQDGDFVTNVQSYTVLPQNWWETMKLCVYAGLTYFTGPLDLSVAGQNIFFTAIGTGVNYTFYAANISAWSGDIEPITFSALEDSSAFNNWELDDTQFSPNAIVPEPSPLILTGVGGLALALRRFLRR